MEKNNEIIAVDCPEVVTINEQLEKASTDFWESELFKKPARSWMSHLRDHNWLATTLREQQHLDHIDLVQSLNFVQTAPLFIQQRHNCEQELVKRQIEWMVKGGEGWIVDEQYGGMMTRFHEDSDLGFRKGIVDTLTADGMDLEAIEEGIEKNANLWREKEMNLAFQNRYEPFLMNCDMELVDPEHRKQWLRIRRYEYYKQHKNSVDQYGSITPDMQMSDDEAKQVYTYLVQKDIERKQYLEQLRQTQRPLTASEKQLIKALSDFES